jgi:outer membrane protein OmpA-like peptidoglycan-associated protein
MCSRALFDLDRYTLKPEAQQVLTGIKASLIDRYPTASVDIEGYTDNLGTAAHNMTLSLNRARSVVEWMQQQGVAQQAKPVGLGMSKPRFPNDNEENRARNRRVEIVLTLSAAKN